MSWVKNVMQQWAQTNEKHKFKSEFLRGLHGFLSQIPWDIFWTQTYRNPCGEWGAVAKWRSCLAELPWVSTPKVVFWSIEAHKASRRFHVHSLIQMSSKLSSAIFTREYRFWKEFAFQRYGIARVMKCWASTPVWYLSKYMTKRDRGLEWMHLTPTPKQVEKLWGIWTEQDWTKQCPDPILQQESEVLNGREGTVSR